MRHLSRAAVAFAALLLITTPSFGAHATVDKALAAAIANPNRTPTFVARDGARHPAEELSFFGLNAMQNVVELWPGGGYWTEIIAPYLATYGHYTVALPTPGDAEEDMVVKKWHDRIAPHKDTYGTIAETRLGAGHFDIAPPNSADLIITFRNLHNWMGAGYAEDVFKACLRALKPGGILGIEAHRGRSDKPQDPKAASGYVREDYAIELAKQAGFQLVGKSEINANPKDTKNWPDGVWTLPPTLTLGDKNRAKYVAIGDADNFVLKFRKPKK